MELRRYWTILRRYWLLALIPSVLVLAVGLATWQPAPTVYNAGVRFIVGQPPGAAAALRVDAHRRLVHEQQPRPVEQPGGEMCIRDRPTAHCPLTTIRSRSNSGGGGRGRPTARTG